MDIILNIVSHPAIISSLCTIFGIFIKTFCPSFIPFLGNAKKVIEELTKLLDESKEDNTKIVERAIEKDYKKAFYALTRYM